MSWKIPDVRRLAVPAVCCLIAFLAYSSQYLFHQIEPGPLTTKEAIWFNLFVLCLWFCYERSVNVDPGRLPKGIAEAARPENMEIAQLRGHRQRSINWCKKCNAVKPPRAHHCSRCKRYIE
jgi:palmitoyltransferase